MDKNKSRTDLLAAGRKKLQQFRQKKDGKGSSSHMKSSKKSSKSEQNESDADVALTTAKSTKLHEIVEEENVSQVDSDVGLVNSLASYSVENSGASDVDFVAIDQHSILMITETSMAQPAMSHNTETGKQEVGNSENDIGCSDPNEAESNRTVDDEMSRVSPSGISDIPQSEREVKHDDSSVNIDVLPSKAMVDTDGTTVTDELEHTNFVERKESLTSLDDTPDMSLVCSRVDQAADGLGLKQCDRSCDSELEGDGRIGLIEHVERVEPVDGLTAAQTGVEELALQLKQTDGADDVSTSSTNMLDRSLDSSLNALEVDGTLGVHAATNQGSEVNASPSDVVMPNSNILSGFGHFGNDKEEGALADRMLSEVPNQQYMPEESFIFVGKSDERPLFAELENSSEGFTISTLGDSYPVNLLQLIQLVKGLGEEEYRLLLKSRASVSDADLWASCMISTVPGLSGLLERLQQELFLTNCTKDILHLQLTEQCDLQLKYESQFHQLGNEISMLRASQKQALEKSDYHAVELAECRSELQATISGKEELRHQFLAARAEVEEVSARSQELQNSLDRLQSEFLSLSKESADSKDWVAALQLENEKLNEILASLTEERNKLADERDYCLHENEKLLKEVADCQSLVAALQGERSNLSKALASVTEERMKFEEEKENLAKEIENFSVELSDCKGLVEALQVENANLSGNVILATEERKKLEEAKEYFVRENERLSSELIVVQERLSREHEEYMQIEVEQREMTMRLEQLTEENMLLSGSLDMYKARCREIDDWQAQKSSLVGEDVHQAGKLEVQSRSCESSTDDGRQQITGERVGENMEKSLSDRIAGGLLPELSEQEVFDYSFGLVELKRRQEQAQNILQKLEKVIEGIDAHSASLSRSVDNVAAPAVLKLIQAFESKGHVDEHEAEESVGTQDQAHPFASTKEHTGNLKIVITQLALDVENASLAFKAERDGRNTADHAVSELKVKFEALGQHSHSLEATNVELEVLYEVVKQHVSAVEQKNKELQLLYENLKQQDTSVKAENYELRKKLSEYESRIKELQDLQQSSDEMASVLHIQLENVQKEAAKRALTTEQEKNSIIAHIVEAVERLDDSAGVLLTSANLTGHDGSMDISSRVTASVNTAVKMIGDLKEKLEAAHTGHEATSNLFNEVNEKYKELLVMNALANDTLFKLYLALRKLVVDSSGSVEDSEINIQDENLSNPADYSRYSTVMEKLETFLAERLQLQLLNNDLNVELTSRSKVVEELHGRCLDLSSIQKLVDDIQGVLKLEDTQMDLDKMPASHLESLVSVLVLSYKEADKLASSSREEFGSKMMEMTKLQEKLYQLNALKLEQENEIFLLKERLTQTEEAVVSMRSELQEKVNELEHSEQRVSSIREKLSIAVAKGKGLVVQRDSLKQSLAETSSELENCSQELQLKDARLLEMETKLKAYLEAGERVEALESELSYIRNSATALRESFLLKDSVLQRIEEILEDLDLPEHFHSRDIIEKIDWLARSVTGNSVPPTDWDQKSSVGGSYSDTGFVMDAWKEDVAGSNSADDLRRRYEELQNKFYGLAEQNEMLEQSLMERNSLVQRWEELLDRIDMPSHLQSVEPEDRIEWLGSALTQASHDRNSLLQNIDKLEKYCGSLTADLEESQNRISYLNTKLEESQNKLSELELDLQAVIHERETLCERLEVLMCDHEKLLAGAVQFELDKENLQGELAVLQEKLNEKLGNEERIQIIDGEISRLQHLICEALQESETEDLVSSVSTVECLERLLRKLIENYRTSLVKPVPEEAVEEQSTKTGGANMVELRTRDTVESDVVLFKGDTVDNEGPNADVMRKELNETLSELMHLKGERDTYMEQQQSLVFEVETLNKERAELQELLKQEEQKSTSAREKLNVAVRKGKSLVQQRDGLKQTIEEMNSELECLKYDMKHRDDVLADYEQKTRDLTTYSDKVKALESEIEILRNHLAEMDHVVREKEHTLTIFLNILGDIDVGSEVYNSNPMEKLKYIGKLCHDLHAAVSSSEQESRKSKRAAELLLAELNEVQERNDNFQEELAKANIELTKLSKERDIAETVKVDALSRLEKLSLVSFEEKKKQYSELLVLKSAASQLQKSFADVNNLLSGVLSKDLEFLDNLEAGLKSCLNGTEANHVIDVPILSIFDGISSRNSENKDYFSSLDFSSETHVPDQLDDNFIIDVRGSVQEILKEIGALKAILYEQSVGLHEQASNISKLVGIVLTEMTSQKLSFEAFKREVNDKESVGKEKEMEIASLRRNIALLYEACTSSLVEIENRKAKVVGNSPHDGNVRFKLKPTTFSDGQFPFGGESDLSSEEHIKLMADRLLMLVNDFASLQDEIIEGDKKEMKTTISNLQKELQEKDIQRERICMELVSQIKEADGVVSRYSIDLQSSKAHAHDLEKQLKVMEEDHNLLEQKLKKVTELEERVKSLTGMLAAKDQEIEALMQALDEEEVQMEDLTNKIEELEKVVQQKNLDVENLESSRGKVLKKLSITVSKFDELHQFSESLLAEVEKLQSQMQDRDAEISFLRQEVTRCTNDVLLASQMSSKRNFEEMQELLLWLDMLVPPIGMQDVNLDDGNQVHVYKETFQKKITSILSELEDLRVVAQSRDALLQMERSKVEELTRREAALEKSLHGKESELNMRDGDGVSGWPTSAVSEIVEVEPVINKWAAPGPSNTSQVRSLRKVNNDQVAIAIDMDPSDRRTLDDDDDDKVHGFKSLATSKIVPKFTRPVTDMIDGLWVSCDRALMRQPALRVGIMLYWAILHALLAAFVV